MYQGCVGMKERINLYLERELVEKAKRLGLNVSQTVEILLKEYVERIEQAKRQIWSEKKQYYRKEDKR